MFALFKISISDILNPYIIQKFKEQATLLTQAVKHDFALLERCHTATKTYFLEVPFREALLEFRFLLCRRSAQGTVAAFLGDRILGSIRLNPSDSIRALVFPLFQNFLACSSYPGERSRCPTHFWLVLTSVWEPWYIILNQFKDFFYITLNYISRYCGKYLDDAAANIVQDLKNLEDFVPQLRYLLTNPESLPPPSLNMNNPATLRNFQKLYTLSLSQ